MDLGDVDTSAIGMFEEVREEMLAETPEYFRFAYMQETREVKHGEGYVDKETATGYLTLGNTEEVQECDVLGVDWMWFSQAGTHSMPTPTGEPPAEIHIQEVPRNALEDGKETLEEKFGIEEEE